MNEWQSSKQMSLNIADKKLKQQHNNRPSSWYYYSCWCSPRRGQFSLILFGYFIGVLCTLGILQQHTNKQTILNDFSLLPSRTSASQQENHYKTSSASQQQQCEDKLPPWIHERTSDLFAEQMMIGSTGLTDKTTNHKFQHMYHRYLSPLAKRTCEEGQSNVIRILEIGLGCDASGGMIRNTPGGSALAWRHLFPSPAFELDLHMMEFDETCAMKWADAHKDVAHVHVGDASNREDLERVIQASGGGPFDVIIDDGSHINSHQIFTLEVLIGHVAQGGIYVIEDIHAACLDWTVNTGTIVSNKKVGGTRGCMVTTDGQPTILSVLLNGQRKLALRQEPYPGVNHIDICLEAAVLQKTIK